VGLEWGPLSLVSITEELLGRDSSGSGLENREYGRGDLLRWPRDNLNPQKLVVTSPTSSGRSVGIVRSRTKVTEFVFVCLIMLCRLPLLLVYPWCDPKVPEIWILRPNCYEYIEIPLGVSPHTLLESVW
jgi:hypothetical protein